MKTQKKLLTFFAISTLSGLFFLCGLVYIYLSIFHFSSDRDVKTLNDPRWRVFDFNSRQAAESEIYNVAEIPVISKVKEVSKRKIRFYFLPEIKTDTWEIYSKDKNKLISSGKYPEIQFPDSSCHDTFLLKPKGINLPKEIALTIWFGVKEGSNKEGLSWPDNYWRSYSSVPFSTVEPYSTDEWAGVGVNNPEISEAARIIEGHFDKNAPTIQRSEQIFSFVCDKMKNAGGIPTDRVQASSPLKTYKLFIKGKGRGFCENKALVYYIFANAAGIKTRLVDIAGKFGPLKLTGHYFCESWIPEECAWCFVDPQTLTANVSDENGKHFNTLQLKRLYDLDALKGRVFRVYDAQKDTITSQPADSTNISLGEYFRDDIVLAYKFGYANNKNFPSVKNFIKYTTLLYAPFPTPKLYLWKYLFLYGFIVSVIISVFFGTAYATLSFFNVRK